MSERRIVDKETLVTHVSLFDENRGRDFSYEVTVCNLYLNGYSWHTAWRSPPNNVVTCFACLAGPDD